MVDVWYYYVFIYYSVLYHCICVSAVFVQGVACHLTLVDKLIQVGFLEGNL